MRLISSRSAGVGPHVVQSARRELLGIDLAVDQPARAGQAEAPEAALDRLAPRRPRRCAARAAASAARRRAAPGGWCCRGRSGNRRRSSRACWPRRASARRRPCQSPRSMHAMYSASECVCIETSGCACGAEQLRAFRRRWCDSRAPRLRRSRRRCRCAEPCLRGGLMPVRRPPRRAVSPCRRRRGRIELRWNISSVSRSASVTGVSARSI